MSSTDIVTGAENNYFDRVTADEQDGGHTEYRCMYVFNNHATEKVEDAKFWMSTDNPNSKLSTVSWAIDPIAQNPVWPFTQSLSTDADNKYLDMGNHADLWSQALTKFSMTMWIFPTAAGDGTDRYVFNHGGTGIHGIRLIVDAGSSVTIRFNIKNAAGSNLSAISTGLNLNQWNYIACVYDSTLGSQNIKVYVNNVLGATTATLTETINNNSTATLSAGTGNTYLGYVKDFRFFVGKALTVSQIDDIYIGQDDAVAANYWLKIETAGVTTPPVDAIASKTTTLNNGAEIRTAQEISSTTTPPLGITWNGSSNAPLAGIASDLGDLTPQDRECPVWIKWVIVDDGTDQDADRDYSIFVVEGKIVSGGTTDPDDPNPPAPAPTAEDFTFAVCGDWGTESMTSTVVNLIKNNSPKPYVVCGVGDNAYGTGGDVDDFFDKIDPIDGKNGIIFKTAFGNHDNAESESSDNETKIKNHFGLSNTYYKFEKENVLFIVLDNTEETSFGSGSSQYNAVKGWLSAGRADPDIDWIVIYAHKPMFGNPSKHDYNDGNFNQAYFPLFDQYKVDLMCFGHNHHMSYSAQVTYNSGNATEPNIKDGSSPFTGGVGRVHVVCGTGGHDANDLYETSSGDDIIWANDTDHGALFVTVTNSGSTTTMTGRFKATDGDTLATFVINR